MPSAPPTRRLSAAAAVLGALLLAGCASGPDTSTSGATPSGASSASGATSAGPTGASPTATAAPSTTAPPAKPVVAVTVEVKGGKVSPPPGRVNVTAGSTVRLTVTSDVADEIHVHGYELEAPMGPGKPAVVEFVATRTGQFEVETHESGKVLTQLLVR